jgi:cytoskeletal protein CcmA (bactofilin family)
MVSRSSKHILLTVILIVAAVTFAAGQMTQTSSGPVSITEPVADDLLTAARQLHVQAEVKGDLAAAGERITIDGPIDGYVMSAGRTLTVDGSVGNDLWAAGETVTVQGDISNNAMLAGRHVHLGSDALVGHDARLAGNTVTVEGRVERNLRIGADTARIGGTVGGDVRADAREVTILPDTVINGDLIVRASEPPTVSPGARILGDTRYEELQHNRWLSWPLIWIGSLLALLVLGFAAVALSSTWPARVSATMRTRPSSTALTGLGVLIFTPVVAGLLAVTLIGIPLAVVLIALYVAVLVLSSVMVSYRVGTWLLERMNRPQASSWARMALGVFVVSLAISIPFAGWLLVIAVLIAGTGALVLERRDLFKPPAVAS